jgi:hypothetical protein
MIPAHIIPGMYVFGLSKEAEDLSDTSHSIYWYMLQISEIIDGRTAYISGCRAWLNGARDDMTQGLISSPDTYHYDDRDHYFDGKDRERYLGWLMEARNFSEQYFMHEPQHAIVRAIASGNISRAEMIVENMRESLAKINDIKGELKTLAFLCIK